MIHMCSICNVWINQRAAETFYDLNTFLSIFDFAHFQKLFLFYHLEYRQWQFLLIDNEAQTNLINGLS